MKAIMLMFDSLRKDMLEAYGNKENITPNFTRLKERCVTFDNCFVGSMPCMPARRELQTGRYNFMHRSWGPMEPFDNSGPEILKKQGIHTHLVTDHKHYWREGGATYHPRFTTYEFIRGQEGDAWKGEVNQPEVVCHLNEPAKVVKFKSRSRQQDAINRKYMQEEKDHPLCRTVHHGLEFMECNKEADQWFLQIECFDPHEPFFVPDKYLKMYGIEEEFNGWPPYYFNTLDGKLSNTIQNYYRALVTMCDAYVGKVIDKMDELDMWKDTMLIVNTDHGFLLGEHDWWGKNMMPLYNEIANIPLFMYHPKYPKACTCDKLVQNIDVAPTLLEFFNQDIPKEMCGKSLAKIVSGEEKHEAILYGYYGSNINICDGKYIYMRAPVKPATGVVNEYTLMPTHINSTFSVEELQNISLAKPFTFTKGIQTMKIPVIRDGDNYRRFSNRLYALQDRKQTQKIEDEDIELNLLQKMISLMKQNDAPEELYEFYGLESISKESLIKEKEALKKIEEPLLTGITFENRSVQEGFLTFVKIMQFTKEKIQSLAIKEPVNAIHLHNLICSCVDIKMQDEILYQVQLNMRVD